MSRFLRFFRVIGVIIACVFGAIAPRAGYADPTYPFTVTTANLPANTTFTFTISAAGTFYVDWGDNSPEQTIDHTGNSYPAADVISHTYTNAGTYTIGLRGSATAYSSDDFIPAVQFGNESGNTNSCQYVRGISGSLGAIFPTIGSDVPGFPDVFNGCTHITSLPGNLFQGVTGARPFMFMGTFARMGITSIPANLFSGISGAEEAMFAQTFVGNDYLTSLPSGLFSGITGTASDLFREAFRDCKRLSGYIPKNLFNLGSGGLTYNAGNDMMNGVFSGLNKLAVSCDSYNLTQYTTSFDSYFGGKVVCVPVVTFMCEQLTGSLPSSISVDPVTSGNVTFTLPSGSMCESYLGYTIDNRWTCEEAVCNNRSWSSDGTAVFNENWDGSTNLHFYMMYTPNVYTITLNEFLDDGNGNNLATPGSVTTLYEEYNTGWSTNSNGPFGRNLTLSASDLPTANGFTFLGWYVDPSTSWATPNWQRIVDAGGHVVGEPTLNTYHSNTTLYPRWESDTGPFNVTVQCGENATWASGFNHSQVDSQSVAYGGSVVLPSVGACVQEGFYFTQWKIDTNGERVNASANNNTSYTWAHRFSSVISPDWQNIETTITLNPQNTTNASGTSGTTALYTIATNYIDDYGVYLDSARTQHMYTINDGMLNNFIAPTKSVTLSLNLNDSVASPASIQYFTDGVAVEPSCIGGGFLNGTNITVPLGFAGYYSVANGGTQYIEKGNSANDGWYLASDGFDAGVAYTTDTTWYGQWNAANPFDVCRKIDHVIPVRPGYTFAGWWTAASGGTRIDTGETGLIGQASNWTIDSNTTIYAHWDVATYTVTLDKNGVDAVVGSVTTLYEKYNAGWSVDNNANSTFTAGLTLSGNQLPTRPGYVFAGYADAASGGNAVGTFSNGAWTPPAANTYTAGATLYAQWMAATYNITYNYNGGTVGSSALPAGYTQLEYIESTGTQYIDTGYKPNQDTSVEITYMYTGTTSSNQIVLGTTESAAATNAVNGLVFLLFPNRVGFGNGTGTTVNLSGVGNTAGTKYTLRYDKNVVSLDGSTIATLPVTTWSAPYNLYLFGRNTANSLSLAMRGRIYSYKAWDNGTLVQHLVPAKNSSNVVGMYDLVSGVFFENARTGDFTEGNAVTTAYPATYTYGTGTTIYGVPSRANSIFESWCRGYDSTNNTYSDCVFPHEITTTDLGNKTMYAKWTCAEHYHLNGAGANESCEADVYTVTLDMNHTDTTGYTNPTPTIYEQYGIGWATTNNAQTTFGNITLTGNQLPTRTGYTFAGYADAATNGNAVGPFSNGAWTPPAATTYNAAATLYAQWTAATYNITYNYNGGTVGSSALPAGYTRVEYLQSDGNQIINTGVSGVYTRAVIDAQYTGTTNALDVLAGYDDSNRGGTYVGVYNKKWTLTESDTGLTSVSALNRSNVSVVFDRDTNNNYYNRSTITVDGETVTVTRSNFRDGNTLKLFNGRSSGASNGFVGRIYRALIYKDNTNAVIFDGVPARRNSDDALGIYDTVSGTFLENIGTGTFTAGADITTAYPATYTYGTGAMVYGMPVRANSVFTGWCRDSTLSIGCGMPHEIAGTTMGDVALYAKYDCVYGYSANVQTGQCELSVPMFTITTTQIEPGTVFKFNLGARGTFVVDWGDGTQPQIINSNTVADTQYTHTYAANAFGGMATKSFTIGFSGRGVGYSSIANVSAIKFFNTTVDEDGDIVSDDQGNPMDGTEVYIASISGSLGAMFPVIGNGGTSATTPSFYQTFCNAKNMSQTMASLADLFNGINGAPTSYMFARTFYGCSGLTGAIPENLFAGISGAPASYMFYRTFEGCSGLTGNIPGNLFAGINGAPASYMFYRTFEGCSGLTGNIPGNLFAGINGAPTSYMFYRTFQGCSGLTGNIPGNLFAGINGTPASNMFQGTFRACSGLTGNIPENLFGRVVNGTYYGINGTPATYMFRETFYGCSHLTGSIPENLFGRTVNGAYYGINGGPANGMFYSTFRNCSGLSGEIPSYLFGHISGNVATNMFRETFRGCSGLTGTIPGNLFGGQNLTGPASTYTFYNTFNGCSNLSGYVPVNLFGQMTLPATPPTGMMTSIFGGTGLATSCPCGTTEVTSSPFRTYWSGRVSCVPGLDVGQHWYNGQCTTMCSDSSIDELHVGALSAFPILADKITTPSINVKYGDTVCYVPLVVGNGGTNSLNMSYGGNVYHADRPDDVQPVGFAQRD